MSEIKRSEQKIPISKTRVAVYSRVLLYLFSAGLMGKSLADLSNGDAAESVGNIGLALILAGMSFRGKEFAVLAYFSDSQKREAALRQLREWEQADRPWVSWIIKCGWILLAFGVGCELSSLF